MSMRSFSMKGSTGTYVTSVRTLRETSDIHDTVYRVQEKKLRDTYNQPVQKKIHESTHADSKNDKHGVRAPLETSWRG
jgi:hypothetical protein